MSVRRFQTKNSSETIALGRQIAESLLPPRFLILRGELGSGKTTLVKGIAEALEAADPDEVLSPRFTLIHEYEGKRKVDGKEMPVDLYHLDLYRIASKSRASRRSSRCSRTSRRMSGSVEADQFLGRPDRPPRGCAAHEGREGGRVGHRWLRLQVTTPYNFWISARPAPFATR